MYRIYQKHLLLNKDIHLEPKMKPELSRFRISNAWFYRRITKWDTPQSKFYYVIQDQPMIIDRLKSKVRANLRKSIKNVSYASSSLDEIVSEAFHLYEQMPAYGESVINAHAFRKYLSSSVGHMEYHVGRRIFDGQIICIAGIAVSEESVDLAVFRFDRGEKIPSVYGMLYHLNQQYIVKREFKYINDGFKSYLHGANFQEKLIREFNYRKCYVEIELYSKFSMKLIIWITKLFGRNEKLKALGRYLSDATYEQR
jgi:hypothetical protein